MILRSGDKLDMAGKVRATLRDAHTGEIVLRTKWNHNIIPNVGLTAMLQLATGAVTTGITYGAVGDGTSTPAATDTAMGNETARKTVATKTVTDQTMNIEFFFEADEANGSITQVALFGGASASATPDSGTMYEYANLAFAITKTDQQVLTVECEISIS
jgi:hypothetical protein